jgi:penicillin-binding protein 1C
MGRTRRGVRAVALAVAGGVSPPSRAALGFVTAGLVCPTSALLTRSFMVDLPADLAPSASPADSSRTYLDRDGEPLAARRSKDGKRRTPLSLAEFGETLPRAVIAAEDKRFYAHAGIDPLAVGAAALRTLREGRAAGGASTLTQQLARTLTGAPRTVPGKFDVMALALRMERDLDKDTILETYLNRVEFGPNVEGAEAAARQYFGKRARSLSLAEAATLAAIPRGPSLYDPRRGTERLLRRRDRVLDRMAEAGFVAPSEAQSAKTEPLRLIESPVNGLAAHFFAGLEGGLDRCAPPTSLGPRATTVTTTLDGDLQRQAEAIVWRNVERVRELGISAAAAVVLENSTGDVLAWVGSPDASDEANLGANDGVRALRQPGSALKPFVYAEGLARGLRPEAVLPDLELSFATAEGDAFRPQNYDRVFHGPVSVRDALGNSFNVPAVWVADFVSVPSLLERLHELGLCSLTRSPAHYGVGLALGDGEISLLELAGAYSTLARGGEHLAPRFVLRAEDAAGADLGVTHDATRRRVLEGDLARVITDMLADRRARRVAFGEDTVFDLPFALAAKTGTSKGYRDNVAAGFSSSVTVAVWVGNFDGSPMKGVSGISGAGPIFRELLQAASRRYAPADELPVPAGFETRQVCALSGRAPGPHCEHTRREWVERGRDLSPCESHVGARVDPSNGLLAGPACTDAVTRVFEAYDPLYAAWARSAGRPLLPERSSPRCPTAELHDDPRAEARILYPEDGARFFVEAGRPAQLRLRGAFDGARPGFLVGAQSIPAAADGTAIFPLVPGRYVLTPTYAGAPAGEPVAITVSLAE